MDNSDFVKSLLEVYLGKGKKADRNNCAFFCPVCNHKNPKLIVNLNSGEYNCFTCHPKFSGKSPVTLLKKINAPIEALKEMKQYFSGDSTKIPDSQKSVAITMPEEFISLSDASDTSLEKRRAVSYLKKRQVTEQDIKRYNMGYCKTGRYRNKVVVPSYDSNGRLNYFVARSFEESSKFKIDSPECKKTELVGFEYYINWEVPVILCEGVFDAVAIKRNAIPLFGKTIPKAVMIKLLQPEVKTVYLALDNDALMESIDHAKAMIDFGKEVYLVQLEGKDPSEVGFEGVMKQLHNAKPVTESDLLMLKMKTCLC